LEVAHRERIARREDRRDTTLELLERLEIGPGVLALAQDVRAIERVKVLEPLFADTANPPPHGRVRPLVRITDEVIAYEVRNPVAFLVRKAKPRQDGADHLRTHALVVVKGPVLRLFRIGARPRLADVVEERGQTKNRIALAGVEAGHRMSP